MYQQRIQKLRAAMADYSCDGLYVLKQVNIRYLTGYTGGGAFLLLTENGAFLITDSRYLEQAQTECPHLDVRLYDNTSKTSFYSVLFDAAHEAGVTRLGFECDHILYSDYEKLKAAAGALPLLPISGAVESMRRTKDPQEIAWIREACACTDDVFAQLMDVIRAGMTEKELEWEIMHRMQLTGNGNYSEFATLSGVNGSYPHGKGVYTKKIQPGDFITMDFGCKCHGYYADMTRTVLVGTPTDKQREIYGIVQEAQRLSAAAVAPGVPAKEIDRIGRDYIISKGYGAYFGHGMGHGLGLEIHEAPFVRASSDAILQPWDVITVEPGIYIPGWGGIRIEDSILVTDMGSESLFRSSKNLICL